jgi:hypothetical protein
MKPYKPIFESHEDQKKVKEQIRLTKIDLENEKGNLKNPQFKNKREIEDRIKALEDEVSRLEDLL